VPIPYIGIPGNAMTRSGFGSMPAVKDIVRIDGTVKESEGMLVFEAKGLEKVVSQQGE
jgi:hypothetical protein